MNVLHLPRTVVTKRMQIVITLQEVIVAHAGKDLPVMDMCVQVAMLSL